MDTTDNNKNIKTIKEQNNYLLLNINYKYSQKYNIIITFDSKNIEIINFIGECAYLFFLNETGNISCISINEKGDTLFVGFSNGKINQYKIKQYKKTKKGKINYIIIPLYKCEDNKNIYFNDQTNFNNYKLNEDSEICLKLLSSNKFNDNNPHFPKAINLLSLNEYHNVLIALDELNLIYIISLNNNFKLMHVSYFLSNNHYKMKEIIPLEWNGDFIIYSSYTVYLFSINGVFLCQLNLLDKYNQNLNLSCITCCSAVFLDDVILFTGHKDGSIIIWKMVNEKTEKKFEEINSYVYNKKKSINFLPEYSFGYNSKYNRHNESKIGEYEFHRKFENVNTINIKKDKDKSKIFITFMKMSIDLDYMILIDNKKDLYILTNMLNICNKKSVHQKKHVNKCYNCNRTIIDEGIRPTLINIHDSLDKDYSINYEIEKEKEKVKEKEKTKKVICDECKQKLKQIESFLYEF